MSTSVQARFYGWASLLGITYLPTLYDGYSEAFRTSIDNSIVYAGVLYNSALSYMTVSAV